MSEVTRTLTKARAKIANPAMWGKGRRAEDRPLHTCCASEALEEAALTFKAMTDAFVMLRRAADIGLNQTIPEWNDASERTHSEVLAAFDKAIEAAS